MKFSHSFLIFSAIFITSCGGGGGGGSDSGPAPTPAATVSLSSNSNSVSINSSVTLTWSSSNASSCSASGDWSGSKATSGNESVVIQSVGNNSFGLSCSGSGGSGQASVSVTGEGFTGVVVDGYIRDATVYLDANASFIQDGDEQATTSDAAGTFTLGQVDANLVASDGIDVDSNNALENFSLFQKASGELNFRAVTPITSAAYYLEGTETINTILGLDISIDVNSTDPVANMNDSDAYKVLYEKGVQITTLIFSLQSALNDINALQETSETYFQEFTKTLEAQYELNSEVVDIETPAFIDAYVDAVLASKDTSLGTTNTTNSKNALHSFMPVISVRNEVSLTTALSNFSTGKFITDFKDMAKGSASADLVSRYVNDINSLIAEDQNVDLNDLVVVISLLDDSATVDEDNSVDVAVLANDTLSTHTYGFSIETSAPTNGQVLLNTDDTISYVPEADFNGSDAFIYTVLVDDRSGSANVNITINPVNDTPIINDLVGSIAISEGQTSVLTVSASDVEGDTLTYSLTGTDAALLSISSVGVITFNTAPVYATKSFYSITVNVSDETDSASQALIIIITNPTEGAPVISGLASTILVAENQTGVITVSASDPDNDALTYSLSGTDAASLSISSSGVITFNSSPDYETNSSYNITVNVSDATSTTSQGVIINISNVNDNSPVISGLLTSISVDENQTAVVTISASDPDGDSLTYSLTGTDASSLGISSSGVITFNSAPDYETKTSYSITVNVSDGINSISQSIDISITDVDEDGNPPVISGLSSSISVAENQTAVVTISASDTEGSSLTYSLTGTDAGSLSISSSGVVTFNSAPDYETKTSYVITVNVSDGTNTTSQALSIIITNLNDNTPVISGLTSSVSVAENQTAVVTVSASDADGDTLTYSLSGTDSSSFSISSSGVITFNSAPDFESKSSYTFTVNVSDGTNTSSQALTVNVSNVNEAPTISSLSSSITVAEGQTSVVTVSASDPEGDTLTYSLSGTDTASLSISSSGVITFNTAPDYETKTSYYITVNVSDGTATTSQALTINVSNVSEAPSISGLSSSISVAENQTAVVTVSASDPDGDSLTYSLTGTDAASLSISSSGVITFNSAPDYETKTSYSITVNVSDGTNTASQALTINITDVNEAPTISGLSSTVTVAENQTSVVTVSASDTDGDTLTYSLAGTDSSSFSISSSGVITFNSAPDYETKNSFSITVNVNDGTATTSQSLTVNVSNLNEAPTISSLSSSITVAEGQTSVVTVSASDPEGASLTYSLTGTDASSLSISSSGVITFNSAPDYETKTSYSVTVNVSDGTNTTSQALTINISNINEAPTITGLASSITVNENQTSVVTVSATDPDSSISYSVSGTDASSFSINSSGVLTFNSAPDYETKTSYSITVNVSDGTNTTSQSLTVSITNLNDNNPSISGLSSSVSIDENDTSVVTVSASDADGESVSYSLTGTDASSLSINSSGVLTFNSAPDYETKTSYSITVNVSDGTNTTSQELTININDITESGLAPGSYDPNVYNTAETLNGGTGNDTMYGYDGDDTINGNGGDDILWGGAGADILTGGDGADRFAVKEACTPTSGYSNISVVTDFTDGEDKILLLDGLAFSDITIFVADENYPDNKGPNLAVGDTYLRSNTHSLLIIKANSFTLTADDFETGSSGTSYCD